MNLDFVTLQAVDTNPSKRSSEIVERKGLGHPDTLADGIAEAVSIEYSQYCLQNFGGVLHHNVDKIAILGGHFVSDFNEGQMIAPIRVLCNGRMSTSFAGQSIDIRGIQETAITQYLKKVLPHLNPAKHLKFEHYTSDYSKYDTWYHPRSLDDLPELKALAACDTSVVVGFWPPTQTERLVLALERYINSPDHMSHHEYLGQDIKVMAYRDHTDVRLTMCVPFLSGSTPSADFYYEHKKMLFDDLVEVVNDVVGTQLKVHIDINTQENSPFSRKKFYMLSIGSCIECGEEGVVGRGNSPMGLISVNRPYSMEAPYGKNPVYHSGKVYSYFVKSLAAAVAQKFDCSCTVYAINRNGECLLPPSNLIVETDIGTITKADLRDILEEHLFGVDYLKALVYEQALLPR